MIFGVHHLFLSVSGYNYYISLIDDCTKYVWLYPLTIKSHAFVVFLRFKVYVENLLSLKIKVFQSDGGSKFTSTRFTHFHATYGIDHRVFCPHTPKQNGVAERKHHCIIEMGPHFISQNTHAS